MSHDAMCPHTTHPFPSTCETCTLIARVRADQQQRDLIGFGALPDEDAIRADEREKAAGRVGDCDSWVESHEEAGPSRVLHLSDALAAIREGGGMSGVRRWTEFHDDPDHGMQDSPTGEWVRHFDYLAELERVRVETLREVWEAVNREQAWSLSSARMQTKCLDAIAALRKPEVEE